MHLSLLSVFVFLAVPLRVIACEGDCITATTEAMRTNYDEPVNRALNKIGQEIIFNLGLTNVSPSSLMQPIKTYYNKRSYTALETAIFPSYFHGKCLDHNGLEPKGCPNPDCPMVCGTPGSIVHFYSIFCGIAFNTTYASLMSSADPHSEAYRTLEKRVTTHLPESRLETGPGPHILRYRRLAISENDKPSPSSIATKDVGSVLKRALAKVPEVLEECCGGRNLPSCTWEKQMKALILSYP